jgi:hypothetical protein
MHSLKHGSILSIIRTTSLVDKPVIVMRPGVAAADINSFGAASVTKIIRYLQERHVTAFYLIARVPTTFLLESERARCLALDVALKLARGEATVLTQIVCHASDGLRESELWHVAVANFVATFILKNMTCQEE